jgi:hypothetical protein
MKSLVYIFTIIFSIAFVACNNEDVISSDQSDGIVEELFEQNEYNLDLRDFALAVGSAMKTNGEFRKLIKTEALDKFDGDYDVLLSHILDKPLTQYDEADQLRSSDNYTVKNLLEASYRSTISLQGAPLRASATSVISDLSAKYPNLQVSVPVHAEDWDAATVIPVVTFVPDEYDDGVTQSVTGYNPDGSLKIIDAVNPPDEAVIVINQNERLQLRALRLLINDEGIIPLAPTNLTATQMQMGILLSWENSSTSTTTGYKIYRKGPSDTNYVLYYTNNGPYNTTYYDTNLLQNGKPYSISKIMTNGF